MRRHAKVKQTQRVSARATATSATAVARRAFPAWIDAGETTIAFPATRSATPRVRDGLVLRTVSKAKVSERSDRHGPRSR